MTSDIEAAADFLKSRGIVAPVEMAMVLGTGLGGLADSVADPIVVPYADIPGFPVPGVSGHGGRLVAGHLEGSRVAIMDGRAHFYEHGDAAAMRLPLQVLHAIGARSLILTNAVGSLNKDWYPGSLAIIKDHINLTSMNPLIGLSGDDRFVSMTDAYDQRFRQRFKVLAGVNGVMLREAVFMWFSGPSFETPAEIKAATQLGADLVGMSLVPETIIARWLKMRVAALSIITNFGAGIGGASPSHTETKDVARAGAIGLRRLVRAFLKRADDTSPTAA